MNPTLSPRSIAAALSVAVASGGLLAAQHEELFERFRKMSDRFEKRVAETPYVGIATSNGMERDLFHLGSDGVSTEPVREAAFAFLRGLSDEQRASTQFAVDDDEWRRWMNQHFYVRHGVSFEEMDEAQRELALNLLRTSLSAKGLELSRDIMRLNHTLGELDGDNFVEFGEWLYHLTLMGEPHATNPWGWQLDGHHLIVNFFVVGDQVVMTPTFVGSEPVTAESGKYAGTTILQEEQSRGLELLRSLPDSLRERAVLSAKKKGNNNQGEAGQDNFTLDYEGVAGNELPPESRTALLRLIELYTDNLRDEHADVWLDEIEAHLDRTYFAWIGGQEDDAVYYYRIHSPVILIEFDHQRPANLRHLMPPVPSRQHIHVVVRTPNGNDYGKDLLRQHLEAHPH
ncbi:MAG: DUF3500 domain-containing protein [Acidobacteriota bacterium]